MARPPFRWPVSAARRAPRRTRRGQAAPRCGRGGRDNGSLDKELVAAGQRHVVAVVVAPAARLVDVRYHEPHGIGRFSHGAFEGFPHPLGHMDFHHSQIDIFREAVDGIGDEC